MQVDCPRCRRALEYSGERPSFCAYCGVPLADTADQAPIAPFMGVRFDADTDPERTGPLPRAAMAETADYRADQARRPSPDQDEVLQRIAGYRLIRRLGSGGMGTVFEAEDEGQSQRVAIKLISREYAASEEAVERFRREGRLASAVTHPRCVFVLAVDEHGGRPYIVMELMPGTTLQTLVEMGGPLDPASAIVKIFDVIEGLREFHDRGLIHRDVKPSNCFLEPGGRVKIGDFGLSKSLGGEADLTRSGTFIGTPLYASPEQIKRDQVDERTDVYSVAATLYFLLSGRPPVQAKDATEALARIVSEPAPPLRSFRPDVPRALEAVVLRGLERDPARRWRSLREFHDALVPFVPDRLSIAGVGLRAGAYLIDLILSYLLSWAIVGLVVVYHQAEMMGTVRFYEQNSATLGWIERGLWFLYFFLFEGLWGASLGKWVVGLRVSRVYQGGPPGMLRGLARAGVFYALTELPADLWESFSPVPRGARMAVRWWALDRLIRALGFIAVWSTMRQRNGLRGPHEWLSGTRVVGVGLLRKAPPMRRLRLLADSQLAVDTATPTPADLRDVGPYRVRGAVRWEPGHRILIGEDSALERPVWIILRDREAGQISLARRALNRQSRPRWIGGGEDEAGRWEAFTAPAGVSLSALVATQGLSWRDVLPILRQITDELEASLADDTLPVVLTPEQVWIRPDGSVQLIDLYDRGDEEQGTGPTANAAPAEKTRDATSTSTRDLSDRRGEERRAMTFLGEVARLGLEGRPSAGRGLRRLLRGTGLRGSRSLSSSATSRGGPSPGGRRIRAAVPERASVLLDRLTGVRPFDSLRRVSHELALAAARPTEVTLMRRAIQLAIQGLLLLPGLIVMFVLGSGFVSARLYRAQAETIIAVPLLWTLWAFITFGGYNLPLVGLGLVRHDGRRAGRVACAVRTSLPWLLPTSLLVGARYAASIAPGSPGLALGLWLAALIVLLLELVIGLLFPRRGPHDWIVGSELVPY